MAEVSLLPVCWRYWSPRSHASFLINHGFGFMSSQQTVKGFSLRQKKWRKFVLAFQRELKSHFTQQLASCRIWFYFYAHTKFFVPRLLTWTYALILLLDRRGADLIEQSLPARFQFPESDASLPEALKISYVCLRVRRIPLFDLISFYDILERKI